jgi:hypothetical protein
MSEVITGGIAAGAVSACAAAVGIAIGVGYVTYRAFKWLSAQAQREMEHLEQELATPLPAHFTTKEVRKEFEKNYALIKSQVAKNPHLKLHSDVIASVLSLKNSPLGSFVRKSQWKQLYEVTTGKEHFTNLLKQAEKRFTQANAIYISRAIVEVAKDVGFSHQRHKSYEDGRRLVVMEDSQGRAIVADVTESENGAKINFDLTGFGDASCHLITDHILKGIKEKNIQLREFERRSHYKREGVLYPPVEYLRKKEKPYIKIYPDQERQEAEERRRRRHYETSKLKLKKGGK